MAKRKRTNPPKDIKQYWEQGCCNPTNTEEEQAIKDEEWED